MGSDAWEDFVVRVGRGEDQRLADVFVFNLRAFAREFGAVETGARAFGFHLSRVSGSHHIFVHAGVRELVNFKEVRGKAKPYQVKQLLALVERYNLSLGGEE